MRAGRFGCDVVLELLLVPGGVWAGRWRGCGVRVSWGPGRKLELAQVTGFRVAMCC